MTEVKLNTDNIPQYVADGLCRGLLESIRASLRSPGTAEELQRRGEEFLNRRNAINSTESGTVVKET